MIGLRLHAFAFAVVTRPRRCGGRRGKSECLVVNERREGICTPYTIYHTIPLYANQPRRGGMYGVVV